MDFVYTFPSSIRSGQDGALALDWQGASPYQRSHALTLHGGASYPQIVPALFSPAECAAIVALGEGALKTPGTVDTRSDLASRDYRISDIAWIEPAPAAEWLFHRLAIAFATANETYRFDLIGFAEPLQFTCYGANQYFGWHADMGDGDTAARKLSLTIQLSDPDEYAGGALQFHGAMDMPIARVQGTGVFFPSYMAHQVTPVTSGLRRSLVAWAYGPIFR